MRELGSVELIGTLRIVRASLAYSQSTSPSSGDASWGFPALQQDELVLSKQGMNSLWVDGVYRVVHDADQGEDEATNKG